jgi:hypothetical protein
MNAQVNRDFVSPAQAVQAVVAEYGLVRVALALAGLIARPGRRARIWEGEMPDRMRRDIGLHPLPPARNYWEL